MSGWVMAGGSHEEGRQPGVRWAIGEADGEELVPLGGVEEGMRKADIVVAGGQQPGEGRRNCICNCWCLDSGISCVLKKTAQHMRYGCSTPPPLPTFIWS